MRPKRPDGVDARPAECLMDVQCGTSGAHRIVVMRTGRTEKRHHGVTNVLVDRTPISDDNAVDEGGKAAYQLADLFRIEHSRYCGESTEISEENGDLPALPCRRVIGMSWARRGRHTPVRNCGQQTLTMAEGTDAQVFQVRVSEITEKREIDIVLNKGGGVLSEAQSLQPFLNVHG